MENSEIRILAEEIKQKMELLVDAVESSSPEMAAESFLTMEAGLDRPIVLQGIPKENISFARIEVLRRMSRTIQYIDVCYHRIGGRGEKIPVNQALSLLQNIRNMLLKKEHSAAFQLGAEQHKKLSY